jgi:hypothetical protein
MPLDNLAKSFDSIPKLQGKENFQIWEQRLSLALLISRTKAYTKDVPQSMSLEWIERDAQVAAALLLTSNEDIITANIGLLSSSPPVTKTVYDTLVRLYGTGGAQYSFALGRRFMENKCGENEDVERWLNDVHAQYCELSTLKFTLNDLYVNVLLAGLPERFTSYIDQVFIASEKPVAEDVRLAILRLNAGNQSRSSDRALAASMQKATLDASTQDTNIEAFYAGLKRSGGRPSKEHPCARCGSPTHWVVDCSVPAGEGNKRKQWKRRGDRGEKKNKDKEGDVGSLVAIGSTFGADSGGHALVGRIGGQEKDWILDSGASEHMSGDRSMFTSLSRHDHPISITIASGNLLVSTHHGQVKLLNHLGEMVTFARVLLVDDLTFNLISVTQLTERGLSVNFTKELCTLNRSSTPVLTARLVSRSWMVNCKAITSMAQGMTHALPLVINPSRPLPLSIVDSKAKATWDIWHRRLAHLNEGSMRLLLGGRSTGGSLNRSTKTPHSATKCEGCVHGKIVRPPFSTSESRAKSTLNLIHTDLCGPMGVDGQKKYMMVIVDDRTRYTWVYFLERKSDALECFKHWLVRVERLTEKTLKTVRSDNGGEYTSGRFEDFLKDKGIEHQTTIPYSSQQNGVAERANRTIVERTIALLHSESLPVSVWDHIAESVVYLKNRSPTRSLDHSITPFEAMFDERPNLSNLRVIGCVAYNMILKHKRESKLTERATLCYLLGYSPTQKGWKLWDPSTRKIVLSRDVIFDESKDAGKLGRTARSVVDISTLLGHSPALPVQEVASAPLDVTEAVGEYLESVGEEDCHGIISIIT